MVQCEMCGTETESPRTVKIEGAELDVCESCAELGTEVDTQQTSTSGTKYSTDSPTTASSAGRSSNSRSSGSTQSSSGGSTGRDMFDELDTLADDYPERIRDAREARGQSQEELAKELNEKASLIRKLERGDVLPSDEVQRKLERALDVSLTGEAGGDADEWTTEETQSGLTLGDMVERRD